MSDVVARFSAAFSSSQLSDIDLSKARDVRRLDILAGEFPSIAELLGGYPHCGGDLKRDLQFWARNEALRPYAKKNPELRAQLQAVAEHPTRWSIAAIDDELLAFSEKVRRHFYLALLGDENSRWITVRGLLTNHQPTWLDQLMAGGLAFQIARLRFVGDAVAPPCRRGRCHTW